MKDDLTVRYEEILRLREELEKLLARSKRSSFSEKIEFPKNIRIVRTMDNRISAGNGYPETFTDMLQPQRVLPNL